jgi:hypothetical protein
MREAIMAEGGTVENAVKLAGEVVFLPGTSQLLDGNMISGAVHATLGYIARALLGPPGLILIAANSFSKSVTGKHLYNHIMDPFVGSDKPSEKTASAGA